MKRITMLIEDDVREEWSHFLENRGIPRTGKTSCRIIANGQVFMEACKKIMLEDNLTEVIDKELLCK